MNALSDLGNSITNTDTPMIHTIAASEAKRLGSGRACSATATKFRLVVDGNRKNTMAETPPWSATFCRFLTGNS